MNYGVIYTLIRTLYHPSAPRMDPLLNNGPQGHLPIQVFMRNLKEEILQMKRYYIMFCLFVTEEILYSIMAVSDQGS